METAVIAAALAVFLLILALLGNLGRRSDQLRRRLAESRPEDMLNSYGDELKKPLYERVMKPLLLSAAQRFRKLLGRGRGKQAGKERERMLRLLAAANLSWGYEEYQAVRISLALALAGALAWFLGRIGQGGDLVLPGAAFGLILGLLIPSLAVKNRAKARAGAILRELPEIMDLLIVSVEAGLGFDAAITRLYEKNKSPLTTELMKCVRDVQMGLPRRESLKALAERNQVQELRTFAAALIQAEQLGVPVKKILRSQANQLRQAYRQRCEAQALKAPVKMIIPMVVFIFPVLFIILLGPSAEQIMEMF